MSEEEIKQKEVTLDLDNQTYVEEKTKRIRKHEKRKRRIKKRKRRI